MSDLVAGISIDLPGSAKRYVPLPRVGRTVGGFFTVKGGRLASLDLHEEESLWQVAGEAIALALKAREESDKERAGISKVVEFLKGVRICTDPYQSPPEQTWESAAQDLIKLVKGLGD